MTDKETQAYIRQRFCTARVPIALRNPMMHLFLKHHATVRWDGSKPTSLISLLEGHITNLERISREILPPYELITKGQGRTFGEYWNDWWPTVNIPRAVQDGPRSWDEWYEAKFGIGDDFYHALRKLQVGISVPDRLRTQGHMIIDLSPKFPPPH